MEIYLKVAEETAREEREPDWLWGRQWEEREPHWITIIKWKPELIVCVMDKGEINLCELFLISFMLGYVLWY